MLKARAASSKLLGSMQKIYLFTETTENSTRTHCIVSKKWLARHDQETQHLASVVHALSSYSYSTVGALAKENPDFDEVPSLS